MLARVVLLNAPTPLGVPRVLVRRALGEILPERYLVPGETPIEITRTRDMIATCRVRGAIVEVSPMSGGQQAARAVAQAVRAVAQAIRRARDLLLAGEVPIAERRADHVIARRRMTQRSVQAGRSVQVEWSAQVARSAQVGRSAQVARSAQAGRSVQADRSKENEAHANAQLSRAGNGPLVLPGAATIAHHGVTLALRCGTQHLADAGRARAGPASRVHRASTKAVLGVVRGLVKVVAANATAHPRTARPASALRATDGRVTTQHLSRLQPTNRRHR